MPRVHSVVLVELLEENVLLAFAQLLHDAQQLHVAEALMQACEHRAPSKRCNTVVDM